MGNSPYRRPLRISYSGNWVSGSNFLRQVPLLLQKRQRTLRQIVELFVEILSCNLAEMTASSSFMSTFLASNQRQVIDEVIDVMIGIRFHYMSCDKCLLMFDVQII
jgi:hypothetical protein